MLAKDLTDREYLYGSKACSGCSIGIVGRLATKVFGEQTIIVLPASCMASVTTIYPNINYFVPTLTASFPASAAFGVGLSAGFKALNKENVNVVCISGDGGTADIGIQALSGAVDQGRDLIYICYDNEAYMNTGIQRSGLTPLGATTTTTPSGSHSTGEMRPKKNMFEIMMAHRVPYAATASTSYPNDYVKKLEKAKNTKGVSYLHVMAPCPLGWGFDSAKTIEIGRMAVQCGMWYLAEYEGGKVRVNLAPEDPEPIGPYLKSQRRYRHLTDEQIEAIQTHRDKELQHVLAWKKQTAEEV